MNSDFHYYATYCAAILAGYSHEESQDIAYSDRFVDQCTVTVLKKLKAPAAAATTQLPLEMMEVRTDIVGLQDITRIWSSFHFLPRDLNSDPEKRCSKRYRNKYRLICGPNGELLKSTVELAHGKSIQAVGLAMHILSDTWAHTFFAGTPSMVINNMTNRCFEILPDGTERRITFRHSALTPDDLDNSIYTSSIYVNYENSIMNLGHGRIGHLPDYSFIKYKFMPSWGGYEEIIKDNPSDYMHAFCQMITAMKYLRGEYDSFECGKYDFDAIKGLEDEIVAIINKRQLSSADDWKALGEKLSGHEIEPYDIEKYKNEYLNAAKGDKDNTALGRFILAALAQKSMVTSKIFQTGSKLAGYSVDYQQKGFKGVKAYRKLTENDKEADDE